MTNITSLEEVIKQNNNLVYGICSKYQSYMDKEDLYQVGMIGLINAYNNFDNTKNVKFSTYAFPYIVGEVSKYVRENKNLKISRDLIKLGKKINEYIQKHYEVRGYKPSIKDIALMLEVKEEKDWKKDVQRLLDNATDETARLIANMKSVIEENKDKTISFDENVEEILDYWSRSVSS